MKKHLFPLLILICCSGCSVVARQYYYVPDTPHQMTKENTGYGKILSSRIEISDSSGKDIGSITMSNGNGFPLLYGPAYVPVVPIGFLFIFSKRVTRFGMDVTVNSDDGHFIALAIDSIRYKKISDSLSAIKRMTMADLHTADCYLIINGSKRVPLRVTEYFAGRGTAHSYQLYAPVGFGKVRSMTIVTGNLLLDDRLKAVVFKRKKRIAHFVLGLS